MDNFQAYARYYNLLYRNKDYAAEAQYVLEALRANGAGEGPLQILDLGCGTGRHALALAEMGHQVTGVDRSTEMLHAAERLTKEIMGSQARLAFRQGDIREVRLNETYDAVISLFHVMSYMTTEQALMEAMCTMRDHVRSGGYVFFDFWYGPAVLQDLPQTRVRRFEDDQYEYVRISESTLDQCSNTVDVNMEVQLIHKQTRTMEIIKEVHPMRYWFLPEIRYLLQQVGLTFVNAYDFESLDNPSGMDWNVCVIGRRT